jgi:peptidoglycan/LPS O-acetylase OafA/YrhL
MTPGSSPVSNESKAELPQAIYQYRPEIDGLRALAFLAILINHINGEWLKGGYIGVDSFFVISGYVVTASLMAGDDDSWGRFLHQFYERRCRRLLPALIAMVSGVPLVTGMVVSPLADTRPPSLAIGLRSYSLYLWHWPVIVLAPWTVGVSMASLLPILGLTALLILFSYRLETLFRSPRKTKTPVRRPTDLIEVTLQPHRLGPSPILINPFSPPLQLGSDGPAGSF